MNAIAQRIQSAPRNIQDPEELLFTTTASHGTSRVTSHLTYDVECSRLVDQICNKLQVAARLENGKLIIDLRDDPALFKIIGHRLLGMGRHA